MPRHPGRVERVGRMSGRGSPALACSLPYPHNLEEGTGKRTRRAGWQTVEAMPCCWSIGGEVVAMTSPRSGRGDRPSLTLGDVASG